MSRTTSQHQRMADAVREAVAAVRPFNPQLASRLEACDDLVHDHAAVRRLERLVSNYQAHARHCQEVQAGMEIQADAYETECAYVHGVLCHAVAGCT